VLTALKKSEDSEQIVVRFYEADGFECEARLRFPKPIHRARRTNLIEDDEECLAIDEDGTVRVPVRPWEIVTLKVNGMTCGHP
jgi:alpha-mannosidase